MMMTIAKSVGKGGINREPDAMTVQSLLNLNLSTLNAKLAAKGQPRLAALAEDGKVGTKTKDAIGAYQQYVMGTKSPDQRVDPNGETLKQLNRVTATLPAITNLTAVFEKTFQAKKLNQMKTGRIRVNNVTYAFRSGNSGRGNLPVGSYTVDNYRTRSKAGFKVDGVGFTYDVSDIKDDFGDRTAAAKTKGLAKGNRTELRIHPDGGRLGTAGCIGIIGSAATLRAFKRDMDAELAKAKNGQVTLKVK
ncbi:hypothetical protein Mal15_56410 [Stieleria maiorica]|uniref:Peptidoglycan binding-like domain-containing protein n=1 Tax=Stieleria maiorica TaxID=2795974 RepID=A0A5B9MKV6_9BACT|nr:hypothetical protein [Stieleria maiorica]QEG01564.1 hypothetical protein Mal15_56410 [Stieleria maiorica]